MLCLFQDIERLFYVGLIVYLFIIKRKLFDWQDVLDKEILKIWDFWVEGGSVKYLIIGDNWDKNIFLLYRILDWKIIFFYLFYVYVIVDRVILIECGCYVFVLYDIEVGIFILFIDD